MKLKTQDLEGAALDWAVSFIEKPDLDDEMLQNTGELWVRVYGDCDEYTLFPYKPSLDWSQGGPLIEKHNIDVQTRYADEVWYWQACIVGEEDCRAYWADGPTPLVALTRCLVYYKLGDEVDVPENGGNF